VKKSYSSNPREGTGYVVLRALGFGRVVSVESLPSCIQPQEPPGPGLQHTPNFVQNQLTNVNYLEKG